MSEHSRRSYRLSHLDPTTADRYDHDLWDPTTARGLEWVLEQGILSALLAGRPQPRVAIDFACGTGRVLQFLAERAPEVIGVDISAAMLEVARRHCPEARLVEGDVTVNPDLVTEQADIVTAFRFLLNAEPPLRSAALEWMRDRLAPGGVLIVNFHRNPRSLRGRYLRLRDAPDVNLVGVSQACRLLANHGLRVRHVRGYSYLPYRRDGSRLIAPRLRRRVEARLATAEMLPKLGSAFMVLAERAGADGGSARPTGQG